MSIVLRAQNLELLVSGKPKTSLAAAPAAAASTINVESIAGFTVGKYIMIGQLGSERTEIIRIHTSSAPAAGVITLNSNTVFAHEEGTPVYLIDFNQIEFSRATSITGSKTVLATVDAAPDQFETIYDDTTNTTGFGFYRFKNSADTVYSSYSDYIPYAGYDDDMVYSVFQRALSAAGAEINNQLQYPKLFDFASDYVAELNGANKKWSEAKVIDATVDVVNTGDWEVTLPTNLAANTDPSTIMQVRIPGYPPIDYIPQRKFELMIRELVFTTLAAELGAADTQATLTSSYPFTDDGAFYVGGELVNFTANTRATGVLTGVSGQTVAHPAGSYVFQRQTISAPRYYTFSSEGKIRLWPIAGSDVNNRLILMSYYSKISKPTRLTDSLVVSDVKPAIDYIAYRIKKYIAGGSLNTADEDYQNFAAGLKELVQRDSPGEPRRVRIG